jgi:hypothetical protein
MTACQTIALAWCSWQCASAASAAEQFKPGDFVEVIEGASSQSCVVSGKYRPQSRDYPVSCGARDLFVPSGAIRSKKPTADEIRTVAETAAALARLPRPGHGLASRYGTRDPAACPSLTEPPSPAQARLYFICQAEVEGITGLVLVTNVRTEVAPGRSFNYNTDSGHAGIDPKQTVYDIRGSFTRYSCHQPAPGENAFARTHNCSAFDEPAAQGLCFKNTFGDWHCTMHDLNADILNPRQHLLAPEGN